MPPQLHRSGLPCRMPRRVSPRSSAGWYLSRRRIFAHPGIPWLSDRKDPSDFASPLRAGPVPLFANQPWLPFPSPEGPLPRRSAPSSLRISAALPRLFNDILEIDVECRFLPALHSGLGLIGLGLIREDNVDGKDAGLQVAKCVLPVTVRFRFLFGSLLAHGLHAQADPGFALDVKNLPAGRSVLRRGARRKQTCQRGHHYYRERPRLIKSLHAPFSFFTGERRPECRAVRAPLSLIRARFQAQRRAAAVCW